jgi:hypothetical protein
MEEFLNKSLKAQDEPSHSVSSKEFISAAAWF